MGNLTDDISRLCKEIETLRDSRKVFESQLDKETREMKTEVSKMRVGFRKDQHNVAVRTRAERAKFVSSLELEVSGLLNAFDKTHTEMTSSTKKSIVGFVSDVANHVTSLLNGYKNDRKKMAQVTKADRKQFLTKLEGSVGEMRKANASDLAGARAVWAGGVPRKQSRVDGL